MRPRLVFLWILIASLAIAAAMGVFALLGFSSLGNTEVRFLVSCLTIAGASLVTVAVTFVADRRRVIIVARFGMAVTWLACFVWLGLTWIDPGYPKEEPWIRLGGILTTLSLWAATFGLLRLPTLTSGLFAGIRTITGVIASLLAASIILAIVFDIDADEMTRFIGILVILVIAGSVATPILALIDRSRQELETTGLESRVVVSLSCPRCGKAQPLKTGGAKCTGCGLRIEIRVEEPRCACGFLLYGID